MIWVKRAIVGLSLLSVSGCATMDVSTGFDEVSSLVVERGGADLHATTNQENATGADIAKHPRPTGSLSLDRALHVALTNSPALQAEYARLAISRADVQQAGLLKNPTLDNIIGVGITPDPTRFAIGAVYPILDIVFRKSRVKAARADFRATQVEVAESVIEHANEVSSAYLDLAQSKARLKARREIVNTARSQLRAIRNLEATGTIDSTDLAEIQVTLAQAEIERKAEVGERDTARIRLAGLLGSPLTAKLDTSLHIENVGPYRGSPTALIAAAQKQRLDLIRAKQEITVRKLALKKAGRLFDEESVEFGIEHEDEGDESFIGPSIAIQVPVFDRGQFRKARGNAELVEAERRLAALKNSIATDVRAAHQLVSARRATALAHKNRLIPAARTRAALARERFNAGNIEATDFLETQLAISEAKLEAIDAAAEYWEARVDLSTAIGGWPSKI